MAKQLTQKEELQEVVAKQSSLEAVKLSEGGQLVIKALQKDILSAINILAYSYKTVSHASLMANCASLAEKIAVYRLINGSSKSKKIAMDELKEFLAENPDVE